MSRVRFLIFPRKRAEIFAAANIERARILYFGRSCQYNRPVQYGRDAAHISWAV